MNKKTLLAASAVMLAIITVLTVLLNGTFLEGKSDKNKTGTSNSSQTAFVSSQNGKESSDTESSIAATAPTSPTELRGMWITFFELGGMFDSKEGFKTEFEKALDKCKEYKLNAVYVHVRSHSDAYYPSEYYTWSKYCSGIKGTQGKAPDFDVLEYMIEAAHSRKIEFHAWINPYRVLADSTDLAELSDLNPAKVWLSDETASNDTWVREANGGLYMNPSVPQVQELVINGIREIVSKYDVDGIHFDDYFYPTQEESFDESEYVAYQSTVWGTALSLADWRRANVNALVGQVYSVIKSIDTDCIFGISPMASINNNYYTVYADVAAWVNGGYIDYIMPQLYFGFEYPSEESRFDSLLNQWSDLVKGKNVKLYTGLGAYRIGSTEQDHIEWSQNDDMLARQITCTRKDECCDGFVIYSYSTFFAAGEAHASERAGVKKLCS